jgi:hypothetical protein
MLRAFTLTPTASGYSGQHMHMICSVPLRKKERHEEVGSIWRSTIVRLFQGCLVALLIPKKFVLCINERKRSFSVEIDKKPLANLNVAFRTPARLCSLRTGFESLLVWDSGPTKTLILDTTQIPTQGIPHDESGQGMEL